MTARSVTWSQRLMPCIIGRHVPPLSQNKGLYFGYPEGNGQLVPPLSFSPKQTDKSWFTLETPFFANRQVLVYFGDPDFLQTDKILVYFGDPDLKPNRRSLGFVAFGNEIAQTDDRVIVEATRTSAFPHSKQT